MSEHVNGAAQSGMPCVSVIMPCYNGEKYVADAIASVLNQPCGDLELIIVNDGSTDRSEEIIKSRCGRDKRIKYFCQENSGVSAARNFGLKNAAGRYIAFLDCDDVWVKNFYDSKLKELILTRNSDVYVCDMIYSDSRLKKGNLRKNSFDGDKFNFAYNHFASYLYKKSLTENAKITFDTAKRRYEDDEFRFKCICAAEQVGGIDKYMFIHRINPISTTHRGTRDFIPQDFSVVLWKELLEWLAENSRYSSQRAVNAFETMKLTNAFEYIKESAQNGARAEEINAFLLRFISIDELKNPRNTYLSGEISAIQREYLSNPEAYTQRMRKENRLKRLVKTGRLKNISLLRRAYESVKYKTNISEFV